jgi:hypothetical protein
MNSGDKPKLNGFDPSCGLDRHAGDVRSDENSGTVRRGFDHKSLELLIAPILPFRDKLDPIADFQWDVAICWNGGFDGGHIEMMRKSSDKN